MNKGFIFIAIISMTIQFSNAENILKKKIDTAIENGFNYVDNEKYNFNKDVFFQYLFTLRNHHLKTNTNIDSFASKLDSLDYKEFYALYDIITKGNRNDRECIFSDSIPFMSLFIQTLLVKTDSLETDFFYKIEKVSKQGEYQLTHCYLSLTELKKNSKYLSKNQKKSLYYYHNILEQRVYKEIVLKLPWNFANSDIKVEAIDFLLMNNRFDLIKPTEVQKILNSQRKEGYWFLIDNNFENQNVDLESDIEYKEALKENFEFAKSHITLLVLDLLLYLIKK